jgi:hypothetical protein
MPDRAAKIVSAIVAGVLAGASLAGLAFNAARAADDCLAAPNGETPQGGHWYYRIEHGTKRHCWYLRTEAETPSQAAAPNSAGPAKPVAPIAAAPIQRSVADAHAELPPRASIEPSPRNGGLAPAMPANPAVGENNNGTVPGADAAQSVVASRWLDPSSMSSTISPQSAPSQMAANAPSTPQADPPQSDSPQSGSPQSDSSQSDSSAAPPPAAAAIPLAAADSSQGLPASLPMLLAVMTGALALAGLTASLVLKFGGAQRTAHVRVRRDRIWEPVDEDSIGLSPRPDADVVPRRPHFPRDLDQLGEPNDRVADFYAQLSKKVRS